MFRVFLPPAFAIDQRNTQAQATSLKHELALAKQQASDTHAAALNAERRLLLAAAGAAATPMTTETVVTPTAATALTAAGARVTAAAADMTGGRPEPIAVDDNAAAAAAAVGGVGVGLKIEKGPAVDTLRLEQLKAELQATTAAKKKVRV